MYLMTMHAKPGAIGLIGRLLARNAEFVKSMCFYDNTFGEAEQSRIRQMEKRIMVEINSVLERTSRPLRVAKLSPEPSKHHHINLVLVAINAGGSPVVFRSMCVNLYPPSRRSHIDADEKSGPARGRAKSKPKRKRKRRSKKEADDV